MKLAVFGPYEHLDVCELKERPANLGIESGDAVLGDIVAVCEMIRDASVVRVDLKTYMQCEFQCSRCLNPFKFTIAGRLPFVVRRLNKGEVMPEVRDTDDIELDDVIYIDYEQNIIDIDDYVRDSVLLSMPLNPVCSDDCKGLCKVCGADLNYEKCECSEKRTDPRWSKLSNL